MFNRSKAVEMQSAARQSNASDTRLELGEYEAKIYVDSKSEPAIYHYVVCRKGDPEIIRWSQEPSLEAAQREAMICMQDLQQRHASAS